MDETIPAYLLSDGYRRYESARDRLLTLAAEFQKLVEAADSDSTADHLRRVARLEGTRAQLAMTFEEEFLPACNDVVQQLFEAERA